MIRGDERYWANMVLDVIEHVECPMLMYEGEKMIVRKALKAYLEANDSRSEKPNNCEDEPQSNGDKYWLSLLQDVADGKTSDAEANQAWYEYINHKDEAQTERPWGMYIDEHPMYE